jgi:ACS family hexuronate transporter-like MFS transporter
MERRWYYIGLVAVAIAISYFDRQTLPIAITAIQKNIPLSDQQFSYMGTAFLLSYAVLYAVGGRLLDVLGTRRGFLLIMIGWSLASALHAAATGFGVLLLARLALGAGEGGAFPAATRVVAEWIPTYARSTAMGLINAGTAVGSVLAPPLIGLVLLHSNWRAMFLLSGALGLAWVVWWSVSYRPKSNIFSVNTVEARLAASEMTLGQVVKMRNVQSFVFAKFMSDSAWYFLLFWLPKYLYDARGFDIKHVSYYAWIPYAASGVGSFVGGWFSSELLRRGCSLDLSRKLALGLCAVGMPVVMLVSVSPVGTAIVLFSIAFFCQQAWSGLIMTLPADVFPLTIVGTVAGLIGFGGAIGGAIFSLVAGRMLQIGFTYSTIFVFVGSFHLIGFLVILLFAGKIRPLRSTDLRNGQLV